tara:strand:+ start:3101 stop:3937 length:837 start_codon:yes stop_codon:yes gene_type:complete
MLLMILCFNGAALFTGRRGSWAYSYREHIPRFNGAALFTGRRAIFTEIGKATQKHELQWGRPFYGAESRDRIDAHVDALFDGLQWGRPFYGAERVWSVTTKHKHGERASMGPPFLRGGEFVIHDDPRTSGEASMGPPFLRGGEDHSKGLKKIDLQARLQWGRPFYGAERVWDNEYSSTFWVGFNGAALFTGRRGSLFQEKGLDDALASMGPPFLRGGELTREIWDDFWDRYEMLQWGRPFYGAERRSSRRVVFGTRRRCFNGAALFTGRRADVFAVED